MIFHFIAIRLGRGRLRAKGACSQFLKSVVHVLGENLLLTQAWFGAKEIAAALHCFGTIVKPVVFPRRNKLDVVRSDAPVATKYIGVPTSEVIVEGTAANSFSPFLFMKETSFVFKKKSPVSPHAALAWQTKVAKVAPSPKALSHKAEASSYWPICSEALPIPAQGSPFDGSIFDAFRNAARASVPFASSSAALPLFMHES